MDAVIADTNTVGDGEDKHSKTNKSENTDARLNPDENSAEKSDKPDVREVSGGIAETVCAEKESEQADKNTPDSVDDTDKKSEKQVEEETKADKQEGDNNSDKNKDGGALKEVKEFKVELNFDRKDGPPNSRYSRVNTVYQIRLRAADADKPLNNSSPDLRDRIRGAYSVPRITSSLLLGNRSGGPVAAVVAQPRTPVDSEPPEFPVKSHSPMADNAAENDDVSSAGSMSAVVVTTAPGALADDDDDGAGKGKPPLQRRMSLNPRMMNPPGLDVLNNKGMVIVRQQMDSDLLGRYSYMKSNL